MKVETIMA